MNYSFSQLVSLASQTGFPNPQLAAAVAMAESGGNACAQGDPNIGTGGYLCSGPNGTSKAFGLWQVNVTYNPQYDPTQLLAGSYNAQAAFAISSKGTNWNPWTTYRTGAYLRWYGGGGLPSFPAARPILIAGSLLVLAGVIAEAISPGSSPFSPRRGRRIFAI